MASPSGAGAASRAFQFAIRPRPFRLAKIEGIGAGPTGRIQNLRRCVTALVRHERLELIYPRAIETRQYAEREKELIPKLFGVLAPRLASSRGPFTNLYMLPIEYPGYGAQHSLLEIRGNPWPPVLPRRPDKSEWLINRVKSRFRNSDIESLRRLIDAARKEDAELKPRLPRPPKTAASQSSPSLEKSASPKTK